MGKVSDLTGETFGRLFVLGFSHTHQGNSYFKCRCSCGTEKVIKSSKLKAGTTKSCGCLTRDRWENLTGKTFGYLKVISYSHKQGKRSYFNCLCVCGNTLVVRSDGLKSGHTKSCGCYHEEKVSKENSFFWKGGITDYNEEQRKTPEYRKARYKTVKRDQCCKVCASKDKLRVHHLSSFATDEKNRTNPNNLVTLCLTCHLDFHKKYGKTGNSYYQFVLYFLGKRKCLDHKITKF